MQAQATGKVFLGGSIAERSESRLLLHDTCYISWWITSSFTAAVAMGFSFSWVYFWCSIFGLTSFQSFLPLGLPPTETFEVTVHIDTQRPLQVVPCFFQCAAYAVFCLAALMSVLCTTVAKICMSVLMFIHLVHCVVSDAESNNTQRLTQQGVGA